MLDSSSAYRHQIVIPLKLNADEGAVADAVPESTLEAIRLDVMEITGGATVAGQWSGGKLGRGDLKQRDSSLVGIWLGDDREYSEPVMTITADGGAETTDEERDAVAAIHQFLFCAVAQTIARELDQESVYYVGHPVRRRFVNKQWLDGRVTGGDLTAPDQEDVPEVSDTSAEADAQNPDWVLVLEGSSDLSTILKPVGAYRESDNVTLPSGKHYAVRLPNRFIERHFFSMFRTLAHEALRSGFGVPDQS